MKKHSKIFKLFLLILFVSFISSINANAQTKKISLQGFLKDANGKAVADGIQSLTFKIYTVASGGTVLWSETQDLKVVGGVYAAQLGSIVDIAALAWNVPYFVGVTVQGIELSPRTELTYAPYSFGTNKAQEVVCSGAVGDVKYSILNPTQFATVNGACWVPMDGRNMGGSKLAGIIGGTNIPNGSGLFIRNHEFNEAHDPDRNVGTAIASIQGDDNKYHTHTGATTSEGNHNHESNAKGGNTNGSFGISYIDGINTSTSTDQTDGQVNTISLTKLNIDNGGVHSHTFNTDSTGGPEARPKNIDFYVYIRIN